MFWRLFKHNMLPKFPRNRDRPLQRRKGAFLRQIRHQNGSTLPSIVFPCGFFVAICGKNLFFCADFSPSATIFCDFFRQTDFSIPTAIFPTSAVDNLRNQGTLCRGCLLFCIANDSSKGISVHFFVDDHVKNLVIFVLVSQIFPKPIVKVVHKGASTCC